MSPYKTGATSLGSKTFGAGANFGANETILARQFISEPMAAGVAFSTSDTIKAQIRVLESAINDNLNRAVMNVMVFSQDGATRRAVLKDTGAHGPSTTEWPTATLTNRRFADGDTLDAGYTTVAGDRLVIEVGGQVDATGGTSVSGSLSFGENITTDLPEDDTNIGASAPWFEISRDVSFMAPAYGGASRFNAGSGTSIGATSKPTGTAIGDTLVAVAYLESALAIGTPSIASTDDTWTLVHAQSNTTPTPDVELYVWICNSVANASSTVSVTWDGDSIWRDFEIYRFTGCDTTTPQDVTATENQGSSANLTGTGLATGTANRLLVLLGASFTGGSAGASWTSPLVVHEQPSGNENMHMAAGHDSAGTDTGNKVIVTASTQWMSVLMALKAPASQSPFEPSISDPVLPPGRSRELLTEMPAGSVMQWLLLTPPFNITPGLPEFPDLITGAHGRNDRSARNLLSQYPQDAVQQWLLTTPPYNITPGTPEFPDDISQIRPVVRSRDLLWQGPSEAVIEWLLTTPGFNTTPGHPQYPDRVWGPKFPIANLGYDARPPVDILTSPPYNITPGLPQYPDKLWGPKYPTANLGYGAVASPMLTLDVVNPIIPPYPPNPMLPPLRSRSLLWQGPSDAVTQWLLTTPPFNTTPGLPAYPDLITGAHGRAARHTAALQPWSTNVSIALQPEVIPFKPSFSDPVLPKQRARDLLTQEPQDAVTEWLLTTPGFNTTPGQVEYPDVLPRIQQRASPDQYAYKSVNEALFTAESPFIPAQWENPKLARKVAINGGYVQSTPLTLFPAQADPFPFHPLWPNPNRRPYPQALYYIPGFTRPRVIQIFGYPARYAPDVEVEARYAPLFEGDARYAVTVDLEARYAAAVGLEARYAAELNPFARYAPDVERTARYA